MKYRELTPNEIEAYNIGYKVGNRQIVITDIQWESENEHKIYRKGYMAGLMDFKRNVSNVSNVSNVDIVTPTTPISISISKENIDSNIDSNKGGMGGKEKERFAPPTLEEVLEYARQQNSFAGCGGFVCTQEQAEEFWSYYESQGWRIGNDSNTPIRDWKPKLRQWCIKAKQTLTNQFGQRVVKMTAKEIKEAENHIKLQKMLNGEL